MSAQAEADNETPIRVHTNVSVYGNLEIHVQLAVTSGLYGNEKDGVRLSLTAADADKLRVQLDELLTVYDRHSITPQPMLEDSIGLVPTRAILEAWREDKERS